MSKNRYRGIGWILLETLWLVGMIAFWFWRPTTLAALFAEPRMGVLLRFLSMLALLNLSGSLIKYLYQRRKQRRSRINRNFFFGIDNIRKLLTAVLIIFSLLQLMGIDLRTLFTSLSIVAAAIAIISKEFVNDLLVGLYYSFSDDFEINDYVKFHNHKGKLIDIGLLKVKILNDNDDVVILPNGKVYAEEIVNYTRRDARVMSIDFELAMKAVHDIESLERELAGAISPYADHIETDSYHLKIMSVRKDFLELKFQYRLKQMDFRVQREIKRKTVRAVYSYITGHQEAAAREEGV